MGRAKGSVCGAATEVHSEWGIRCQGQPAPLASNLGEGVAAARRRCCRALLRQAHSGRPFCHAVQLRDAHGRRRPWRRHVLHVMEVLDHL